MTDSRAASRYVKSLLDLAIERNALEAVHKDMLAFSRTAESSRPFMLMLRSPVIKHDVKREILHKLLTGKVHSLTLAIVDILTRKNREPLLPIIARGFHAAYNEYKQIGEAEITTAVPLDAGLRKELDKVVRNVSGKNQVELREKVDPGMIGGFVLNIGDKQIDASIRNKIKSLKIKFSQNPYIKEI